MSEGGEQLVSVSLPIQRVRAVVGVLTLEAGDVDEIIAAERAALIPFILIAVAVTLLSSFLIYFLVARPGAAGWPGPPTGCSRRGRDRFPCPTWPGARTRSAT